MSASLSATVTGGKLPKSQSAAKAPQVGWNDVHVRPFSWNDIDRMVDYMFRSPRDLPFLRTIDFEKFPRENDYRAMLNDIASSFEQKPWLTIEYKGQPIGVHPLTGYENGQADFHAHIWNSQLWGKGIGAVSWFKACAYFFEQLESLEILFFRVPKDNPMPTGWAKKLPLKSGSEEVTNLPYFKQPVLVKTYKITRSEFDSLASPDIDEDESDL